MEGRASFIIIGLGGRAMRELPWWLVRVPSTLNPKP